MNNYQTNKNFLVVGCGGLGCYIIEGLLRMNVKSIKVCDPDVFSTSNLNRQLYSLPKNINEYKVDVASQRAKDLNYQNEFITYKECFNESMLENVDVVIDALDNIESRLLLEDACSKHKLPLIHGAVENNTYQVGVIMPYSNVLHSIYKDINEPKDKSTNVVTVLTCASKQLHLALSEIEEYFEINELD